MEHHHPFRQQDRALYTSADLLIQEIPDDETGYDADVEILRPDEYEELDSEKSEEAASSTESEERWRHDLIKHMKSLTCNPDASSVPNENDSSHGRKRRSKDAFGMPAAASSTAHSEGQIEVTEVVDDQYSRLPPKRVRHGGRRSKTANQHPSKPGGSESEAGKVSRDTDAKSTPQESTMIDSPRRKYQDDDMDLG
jgi:hypothetical protein